MVALEHEVTSNSQTLRPVGSDSLATMRAAATHAAVWCQDLYRTGCSDAHMVMQWSMATKPGRRDGLPKVEAVSST